MNAIVQFVLPYVLLYKYWALFGVTFVAALILPIPPGTLIMGVSALASQGKFSFALVLIAAISGNILGDTVGFFLARKYGKRTLEKIGFKKILASSHYRKIQTQVRKRPGFIIFISRFEVFANLSVNIIAGLGKIPYRKYAMYQIPGEILQVSLYGTLGYIFGNSWQSVNTIVGKITLALVLITILILVIFWKRLKEDAEI
jgi:membrane-associated protein